MECTQSHCLQQRQAKAQLGMQMDLASKNIFCVTCTTFNLSSNVKIDVYFQRTNAHCNTCTHVVEHQMNLQQQIPIQVSASGKTRPSIIAARNNGRITCVLSKTTCSPTYPRLPARPKSSCAIPQLENYLNIDVQKLCCLFVIYCEPTCPPAKVAESTSNTCSA